MRFRNGLFQALDGGSSSKRLLLAVEAVHFDAAIVGHHFPEAQMGERGEMQEFADRQLDADLVIPRRHPQLAGVIPLAPAGGADGIAKNPEPGVVAMNVLFAAAAWGEGFYRFDRLGDVLGGCWPASS